MPSTYNITDVTNPDIPSADDITVCYAQSLDNANMVITYSRDRKVHSLDLTTGTHTLLATMNCLRGENQFAVSMTCGIVRENGQDRQVLFVQKKGEN